MEHEIKIKKIYLHTEEGFGNLIYEHFVTETNLKELLDYCSTLTMKTISRLQNFHGQEIKSLADMEMDENIYMITETNVNVLCYNNEEDKELFKLKNAPARCGFTRQSLYQNAILVNQKTQKNQKPAMT